MENLFGVEIGQIVLAISLLSPGVLISYFRNNFITGRHPKISEKIAEHLTVSAIYFSSFGAIFLYFGWTQWPSLFALLFAIPTAIGIGSGTASQKKSLDFFYEKLGLNPIHPATTGWDFMFGTMASGKWVIVTLSDGTRIRGWFDRNSGASSDLTRRDIFISDIRKKDYSRFEADGRNRGIWLHEDEIRHIEIIND